MKSSTHTTNFQVLMKFQMLNTDPIANNLISDSLATRLAVCGDVLINDYANILILISAIGYAN